MTTFLAKLWTKILVLNFYLIDTFKDKHFYAGYGLYS